MAKVKTNMKTAKALRKPRRKKDVSRSRCFDETH